MSVLPSGTVSFVFTDIEGSTRLWQEMPQGMAVSHARHDAILREAIESNHGYVFKLMGDSFCAAFDTVLDGLRAMLAAQRALQAETWGETGALKVRMGLHTGAAEITASGDYEGYTTIASIQRVMSAANGGQMLVSQVAHELLQPDLPADVTLRDLGEHRLKDLRSPLRIYQVNAAGLPQDFPPIKSLNTLPNNLPAQLTSFIGREKEVSEVRALLQTARLVTLTGSGGTGKTRLSIEVGGEEVGAFAHGVWMIELAPLSDPAQIIPALGKVFGLREMPFSPLEALLVDYLRDKKLLLILDNCEHLIAACARVADEFLRQCAGLKILASSREGLGIAGEAAYRIPSLPETEATRLFVERACAVNSNFKLTEANASATAQLCAHLDGIPLAIELAAARTKLLSVEQIAARLDDRFRLLVGGSRTALPRQQTLRALIDWSYGLLPEDERKLLRCASVFVGGWTLEALEFVADDPTTLELLEQLVNKSLVVTEERTSEMRYSMLESIRQYSREKLFDAGETRAARDRHFTFFNKIADEMWISLRGLKEFVPIRERVFDEYENMRAALEWGIENHPESALDLAGNMAILSNQTGLQVDSLETLKLALERFRELPPVEEKAAMQREDSLSRALYSQGAVSMSNGGIGLAKEALKECISISRRNGNRRLLGYALEMYYNAAAYEDKLDGLDGIVEGFEIFKDSDDLYGRTFAFINMARLAWVRGDYDTMQRYFDQLKGTLKAVPVSIVSSMVYIQMGYVERGLGHLDAARQNFEECLKIMKSFGMKFFEVSMLADIGHIQRAQGNYAEASRIYHETLPGFQDYGNRSAIAHQLECFGFLAVINAEPQRAAKLFGAAEALRENLQSKMTEYEQMEYDQSVAKLRSMLSEAQFSRLWEEGGSLTMKQAIEFALR